MSKTPEKTIKELLTRVGALEAEISKLAPVKKAVKEIKAKPDSSKGN